MKTYHVSLKAVFGSGRVPVLGTTHFMKVWVSKTYFEAPLRPHTSFWALRHPPTSLMGDRHQSARFRRLRSQHTPLSSIHAQR